MAICRQCGADFRGERSTAVFCSARCRVAAHRGKPAAVAAPNRNQAAPAVGETPRAQLAADVAALVEHLRETMTAPQRVSFDRKRDAAVDLLAHQLLLERLDDEFGAERARATSKERELDAWASALEAREADVTTYMTEQEYKLVLGCLHPDRAGNDETLRRRLDRAFEIFRRLQAYIRQHPASVLRERGWADTPTKKR